ncbi:hypothetical protein M231_06095 [Tremella mesenterica]|uniref:Chromatin-remodeling ATPase INO80 n=1 Tax=Tremella mesenterica TaxID=5217 RepID=A0A4Q1BCR6_TREME|nr:hypothetical protein M231_06095 [Tremella mesenterica]
MSGQDPSPPRTTPSGRMALSALVNSPPPSIPLSPLPNPSSPTRQNPHQSPNLPNTNSRHSTPSNPNPISNSNIPQHSTSNHSRGPLSGQPYINPSHSSHPSQTTSYPRQSEHDPHIREIHTHTQSSRRERESFPLAELYANQKLSNQAPPPGIQLPLSSSTSTSVILGMGRGTRDLVPRNVHSGRLSKPVSPKVSSVITTGNDGRRDRSIGFPTSGERGTMDEIQSNYVFPISGERGIVEVSDDIRRDSRSQALSSAERYDPSIRRTLSAGEYSEMDRSPDRRVLEEERRILGEDRHISGAERRLSGEDRRLSGEDGRISGERHISITPMIQEDDQTSYPRDIRDVFRGEGGEQRDHGMHTINNGDESAFGLSGEGSGNIGKAYRLDDVLAGSDDIWQRALQIYQERREAEAAWVATFESDLPPSKKTKTSHARGSSGNLLGPVDRKRRGWPSDHPTRIAQRERKAASVALLPKKPRSHKKKMAAALEDELLDLAGDTSSRLDSDDERPSTPSLRLSHSAQPTPHSNREDVTPKARTSASNPDDPFDQPEGQVTDKKKGKTKEETTENVTDRWDPDIIVQPSGLTRAEVITKVESGNMRGLTEEDVKAVQDEMWMRQKIKDGKALVRKDGTIRKKPGPAKGWKKLRRGEEFSEVEEGEESETYHSTNIKISNLSNNPQDSSPYDVYDQDEESNELENEHSNKIGVRKDKDKGKGKENQLDSLDDQLESLVNPLNSNSKKTSKVKEPGVGKGRWTRPPKDDKKREIGYEEDVWRIEGWGEENYHNSHPHPLSIQQNSSRSGSNFHPLGKNNQSAHGMTGRVSTLGISGLGSGHNVPFGISGSGLGVNLGISSNSGMGMNGEGERGGMGGEGNVDDPRGVSEIEAIIRYGLVDDLQRQIWAGVVRDVPRMYRVYQSSSTVLRANALRTAQACYRNSVTQRSLKPSFKTTSRQTKETISRSKKIMKELSLYWRKNEKDELAARKRAEKEALEKAKLEEEKRESKRQARKLNFLLTQTELYSHFVGKKIKTKEAEDVGDDIGGDSVEKEKEKEKEKEGREELGLDDEGEPLPDIDYDDDDEENLRRHAARGAQAAVKAARDKAKAFDQSNNSAPIDREYPFFVYLNPLSASFDGDELNFQNPTLSSDAQSISQPRMLMAQLKEYQLKGLTWLGNLYEQGINGILADEMGLGKTIQSISLLAYLAETHNLWGPFLVIAPSSTLHNWQQELARFVPRLKTLPYWGSPKDRETLRKVWCRKNLTFDEGSPFHVLVTSYQLAVQDEKYFQGTRWQYMILDEAQAIKSSSSARWKSLLSLHCRNRLLLTGTPIQNSMHELWALLHFIMPSLFDSHEEFSEWFSKDIENAAGSGGATLKPEQLRRLHVILKPFMLRRIKKHVQKELGDKIEIDLLVDLSQRQRSIYRALRQRVSVSDLLAQANQSSDSSLAAKNLMNLVMQFRKVCNHPDLFERADVVSPYMFGTFSQSGNLARQVEPLYCPDSARNAIDVKLPRLVWEEGKLDLPSDQSKAGDEGHVLRNLMNIWREDWVEKRSKEDGDGWGFLKIAGLSPGQVARKVKGHPLVTVLSDFDTSEDLNFARLTSSDQTFAASEKYPLRPLAPTIPTTRPPGLSPLADITSVAWNTSYLSRRAARFVLEKAVVPPIRPYISSRAFLNTQRRLSTDPTLHDVLYGVPPSQLHSPTATSVLPIPPQGLIRASPLDQSPAASIKIPAFQRLIVDSAKLARLDELLRELKAGGHRVLLYFQMTRMMDLAEEYLIYRQYKYLRLDGGSPIGERRDMVTSWQTNSDIFVFCLSTRAGGLGINLTAADTVIFYDHDWNPSNDAQAMDRAHRVGQTKQVTVYRLIARGTIEERIIRLARGKKDVQDIVVGAKSLTDVAKPAEIVSLFMDDDELAESVAKRKQAEAHGYVAPMNGTSKGKTSFGDALVTGGDEDEDDFFSLGRKVVNGEDEEYGDEGQGKSGAGSGTVTPLQKGGKKRKAENEGE